MQSNVPATGAAPQVAQAPPAPAPAQPAAANLTNGRAGRANGNGQNGLRNKNGLTNGNHAGPSGPGGLVNGNGTKRNGAGGLVNGNGITNGNGTRRRGANGLVNGNGMTNGNGTRTGGVRGLVNGNGITNGNMRSPGAVNGTQITATGLTNGRGAMDGRAPDGSGEDAGGKKAPGARRRITRTLKVLTVLVVAACVVMPVTYFLLIRPEGGIKIDGSFSDWAGARKQNDELGDQNNPEINIATVSLESDGTTLSFYVKTMGKAMGGRNGGIDSLFIFIDTDQGPATGYGMGSVGAEYVLVVDGYNGAVSAAGLYKFTKDPGRPANDWNSKSAVGSARAVAGGSELEAQVSMHDIGVSGSPKLNVQFLERDFSGGEDIGPLLSTEGTSLLATLSRLGPDVILPGTGPTPLRMVELKATGGKVTLSSLRLHLNPGVADSDVPLVSLAQAGRQLTGSGVAPSGGSVTLSINPPVQVSPGTAVNLEVHITLSSSAGLGKAVGLGIEAPADIGASTGAVSVRSNLIAPCYIGAVSSQIVIDGAFSDWASRTPHPDPAGDVGNPNIDITDFRMANDTGSFFFYLKVGGAIMGGSHVPESKLRPTPSGGGGGGGGPPVTLPVLAGEDAFFVFLDTDNSTATGYSGGGISVGAEYLVKVTGQDGRITSRKLLAFTGGADRGAWSWSAGTDLPAASDATQLESQVTLSTIGGPTGTIGLFYYSTDWKARKDSSAAAIPYNIRSGGGRYYHDRSQLTFGSATNIGQHREDVLGIATADFDNDGDIDVVASMKHEDGNSYRIYENKLTSWTEGTAPADIPADDSLAIVAGDLDNDGKMDFVTGNSSGNVTAWRNGGNPFGTAFTSQNVGTINCTVYSLALADLDNDGWLDIVSGGGNKSTDGNTTVWKNDGTPFSGKWNWNDLGNLSDAVLCVAAADLDLDGDVDIATGSDYVNEFYSLVMWENDGTPFANTWTRHEISITGAALFSIGVTDLDRDGYPDIVAGSTSSSYSVYAWDGKGTFVSTDWASSGLAMLIDNVYSISLPDLDHDGYPDIVAGTGSGEDYDVIAFENTGDFNTWSLWSNQEDISDSGSLNGTFAVATADLDNDGDMEILAGGGYDGSNWDLKAWTNKLIHRNMPFSAACWTGDDASNLIGVAAGDLDRDGRTDLVVVSDKDVDNDELKLFQNDGTPFEGYATTNLSMHVSDGANCVAVADLDNDGWLDIITGNGDHTSSSIQIWKNDGTPFTGAWTATDVSDIAKDARSVAVADLDNDGWLDIVAGFCYTTNCQLVLYENDGTPFSGSWTGTEVGLTYCTAASIAVADLNLDGYNDIAVGTLQDNTSALSNKEVKVFQNDKSPFDGGWTENDVGDADDAVNAIAAADLDNDGYPDLATASDSEATSEVMVWQNDKTPFAGTWSSNGVGAPGGNIYGLAAGDIDQDGRVDLVSGGEYQSGEDEVIAWRNSDSTPFTGAWTKKGAGDTAVAVCAVALADLDNDSRPDIASAGNYSGDEAEVQSWRNIGGQATVAVVDTSPAELVRGTSDDIFKITVTNNGLSGDDDIELATWTFNFTQNNGFTALSAQQMSDSFIGYEIYLDDGDGSYDGDDTWVDTSNSTSDNNLTVTFTDSDASVAVSYGSSRTYFLVVNTSSTGNMLSAFMAIFDPDGYCIKNNNKVYNEVENSAKDKIVHLQEAASLTTGEVKLTDQIPEFQDLVVPMVGTLVIFAIFRRGRKAPLQRRRDRKV